MIQPVDSQNQYTGTDSKVFRMIDNYIYLYHTKTLVIIPTYPNSISDTMSASFNPSTPLARSAPIYSYSSSGPRSFQVELNLHRDMLNNVNTDTVLNVDNVDEDYVDILVNQLRAVVLPRYAASEKLVDPPVIAVKFGSDFFCKGIVNNSLSITYSGPILTNNKYALITISFTITEIDPYDAESVMTLGGYRGLSTTLEKDIYKTADTKSSLIRWEVNKHGCFN